MNPDKHLPYYQNFKQKKRFSQVFLKDYSAVSEIFDNLDLKGKCVVEIGAGEGVITKVLAKKAKKVLAIEIDPELCKILSSNMKKSKNVEVVCADALQASLNYPVVIGFIPYHISSPLIFKILGSSFEEALLCVQKEFADRLVASPGTSDYSKLSVMSQSKADITYLATVPASAFSPVPKVDSALVYLVKKKQAALNEALISALFQHKNQTIKNAIMHSLKNLNIGPETAKQFLSKVDSSKRARTLSIVELERVCTIYDTLN
ncbi:MAG: 16S rRNA (adenine(1518)-N(6)/adenine(1519)-N(6))-dimethyltransferase RsmA [Candidatus Micrarchaeota archaeon]